ncbi:MAG: periplasmic heavy metal sensor [Acidobacteria bacterium]|nr:MAG: periplasmic heavy metal sensor [Acidobacteriota bacterium]
MRTRWFVLALGLSLAANVTLGVALWVSWHGTGAAAAALGPVCAAPLCQEERTVREELAAALCTRTPDRAAIDASLARLDQVRAGQRNEIVERWLARCSGAAPGERAALGTMMTRLLCPWRNGEGAACCAPTPAAGARPNDQPLHGQP